MKQKEQVKEFLEVLFSGLKGYVELRTINSDKDIRQFFYSTGDIGRLLKDLNNDNELFKSSNVYFGVCPRETKIGKEENVKQVNCLWVDLDCDSEEEREINLKILNSFEPSPSSIVDSGHGYHCYWLLEKSYLIVSEKDKIEIKGDLKGLAIALKGDRCFDLARILRVPGTLNLKDPQHPLPVSIIKFEPDLKYKLEMFDEYKVDVEDNLTKDINIFPVDIPNRFWKILESDPKLKNTWEGNRPDLNDQSRSGYDMSLADQLMSYDFNNSEIASILIKSSSGRGKESKQQYLQITIGKARESWNKRQVKKVIISPTVQQLISESLTVKQLLEVDLPEEEFLIEKGIMPKKGYVLLAGLTKEGKTIFALQMALHLVLKIIFLGQFDIKKKVRVLYLYAENTQSGLRNILKKQLEGIRQNIHINEKELNKLILQGARGLILDNREGNKYLEELVIYHRPDVIFIDPISLFTSRDLNKLENATKLIRILNQISEKNDCTWVIVHHYRKPSFNDISESIYKVMGSSGFANYCESFIGLERAHRQRSSNYKKLDIVLRREESPEPIYLFRDSNTLLYELATKEEAYQSGVKVGAIIDILKNELGKEATFTQIVEKGKEKLGVSKTRIKDLLLLAEREALVVKGEGQFGKWSIKE